jgi:hypothetical protein
VVTATAVVIGVGAGVALTSCGGGGTSAAKRRVVASSPTTLAASIAPLTGLPDPSGISHTRGALAVKIDNTPEARPQSGLDAADVVYEEVVEGGITRFWSVFNSAAPTTIGPIRSIRVMDPNIVSPLGGVVAYSGGTPDNVTLMRAAPVTSVDENNAGDAFSRSTTRDPPHNLYGASLKLWDRGESAPPKPIFTYLGKGDTFAGEGIEQFHIGFSPGYDPTFTFDPASRTWKRSYGATPFTDISGTQIAPTNVIVQFVNYSADGDGQLIGDGDAWVFSDQHLVRGRWTKPDAKTPTKFVDAAGAPIQLTPGRTSVELVPAGASVDLVAAPPPPPTTRAPTVTPPTTEKRR